MPRKRTNLARALRRTSNEPGADGKLGSHELNDPRCRFNWGYHDARLDREMNRGRRRERAGERPLPSWSPAYVAGYNAGWDSDRGDTLSDKAWTTTFPELARYA